MKQISHWVRVSLSFSPEAEAVSSLMGGSYAE
jgi:hypothetical protein